MRSRRRRDHCLRPEKMGAREVVEQNYVGPLMAAHGPSTALCVAAHNPEDLRAGVDPRELLGHERRTRTLALGIEDTLNSLAQRLRRWRTRLKIDPDPGPCHTRIHVGFVFGQSSADQWNTKTHRLI